MLESSVVRAFAHGAMGRRIDPSWGGPIELFLVPGPVFKVHRVLYCSGLVLESSVVRVFAHGAMGRRIDPSLGGPIELFLVPVFKVGGVWF